MSREEYQIPVGSPQQQAPAAGGDHYFTAGGPDLGGGAVGASLILYSCGDCGFKFELKKSEPIRCSECGCRVLYKNRTNRMIEFEAR